MHLTFPTPQPWILRLPHCLNSMKKLELKLRLSLKKLTPAYLFVGLRKLTTYRDRLLTTIRKDADRVKRPIKPNKSSQSLRRILSSNRLILWEAGGGHPKSSTLNLWPKIFLKQRSVLRSLANTSIRTSLIATQNLKLDSLEALIKSKRMPKTLRLLRIGLSCI